jgi:DNA mismatch endonuclease, patch repair protein
MADVHEPEIRSYNMSRIKSKDTKPEILVRRFLYKNGFRYRLNLKNLPGKPDIVLTKHKIAIFVHGCFWHGHQDCKFFVTPKTRTEFWTEKILTNIGRDKLAEEKLSEDGWRILKIWECELKPKTRETTLKQLMNTVKYFSSD